MLSDIRPAIVSTVLFTLALGLGYPLAITAISEVVFPYQANGSLMKDASGQVIGSALLAQPFAKDQYLHPRPSAAGTNGYDPTSSGGSNYGPLNADLAKRVKTDAAALRKATGRQDIPDDAITPSASGLDPDISPAYASLQVDRVAHARAIPAAAVGEIVAAHTDQPFLGFIGQPAVNVLAVNRALDERYPIAHP